MNLKLKTAQPKFDLKSQVFVSNPYPTYKEMQNVAPVYWDEELKCWVITRYEDVKSLATPSFTIPQESFLHQAAEMFPSCKEQILEIGAHQSLSFVYMEQPEHTRVRGLFQPQFTRAAINQFRPRLQKIVSEMLDKINPQNQVELRYEFAEPFAIRALREYMWPPKFDGELFFLWVDALLAIRSQSMISDPQGTIEHYLKLNEAVLDYIRSIVIDRRINPSNDLLSHWIKTAFDENDEQPERMLLENLKVIIVAGIVTTPNSIINTIRLLCAHPEQFEEVKANLNLVPQAFKESLRHSVTVQMTYRRAAKDFEIHGVEIHANDNIGLCLGAANRDPRIFESPHIFNIHRKENLTLEFGHGPHICLGKHLAHLEGEAAITEIIKRWPGIQVALSEEEIEWERDAVFLKIKALPVRLL